MLLNHINGPHNNTPLVLSGSRKPNKVVVLVHGRGGTAADILSLTEQFSCREDVLFVAPQAQEYTWYPQRFIQPKEENQPFLDSALEVLNAVVEQVQAEYSLGTESVILAGFSQGACLVAEYIAQHPARYAGVCLWSGGLIGTTAEVQMARHGDLAGTSVYIGCDTKDAHIPAARVEETFRILAGLNATVEIDWYEGFGHSVHERGVAALQRYFK